MLCFIHLFWRFVSLFGRVRSFLSYWQN